MMRLRVRYIEDQPSEVHPNHEPTLWLRNEVAAALRAQTDGTGETCGHVDPTRLSLIMLHRPDFACCGDCATEVRQPDGDEFRCDRCGVQASGDDRDGEDDQISGAVIVVGAYAVGFGLCDSCLGREVPEQ